jgi:hypothetical protein
VKPKRPTPGVGPVAFVGTPVSSEPKTPSSILKSSPTFKVFSKLPVRPSSILPISSSRDGDKVGGNVGVISEVSSGLSVIRLGKGVGGGGPALTQRMETARWRRRWSVVLLLTFSLELVPGITGGRSAEKRMATTQMRTPQLTSSPCKGRCPFTTDFLKSRIFMLVKGKYSFLAAPKRIGRRLIKMAFASSDDTVPSGS